MPTDNAIASPVRIDVWLWAARFFKTRSLCKQAVEGGKVSINAMSCKPSRMVRVGDNVRVTRGEERLEVVVLALSEQRGPASVAQQLYRETDASRLAREQAMEQRRLAGRAAPSGKPDKRARRLIRALGDIDAF